MQTGRHALTWSLQRLGIGIGIAVIGVILAYILLVFVIVAIQATAALGQ